MIRAVASAAGIAEKKNCLLPFMYQILTEVSPLDTTLDDASFSWRGYGRTYPKSD